MRRAILTLALLAAALWSAPCLAQSRAQLGPLCTTDTTPADQQIDACNKIIALKVFTGEKLATKQLLDAYARARATGDREPFAFPHADDRCDDPGDVFGDLQLVDL